MRTALASAAGLLIVAGAGLWASARGAPPSAAFKPGAAPVIVELFSSEGCSSCPPADAYVAGLDRTQPISGVSVVVLEQHVDYWDDLGWRDPFGQAGFGERQRGYASVLSDHRVFTPEIVVDGRDVEEGDEATTARDMQAAARRARATITLARHDGHLDVRVTDVPRGSNDADEVWLAVTESGLESRVASGENRGHTLVHGPIVRTLRKLGTVTGPTFHSETAIEIDPKWNARALRTVVFVQEATSRHIVGAAVQQ